LRRAAVGLALNHKLVARQSLDRLLQEGVRSVLIGDVEEGDPAVEGVPDKLGELRLAEPGLVGGMVPADGAGPDADERTLDTRLAELDPVRCRAQPPVGACLGGHPERNRPGDHGGFLDKLPTVDLCHGSPLKLNPDPVAMVTVYQYNTVVAD